MDDPEQEPTPVIAKPDELLALHSVTEELFTTLKRWFQVPDSVALDLGDIDAVVHEMADPTMIAALAMRKLQALRLLATPGVQTSTDVVLAIVNDLERALLQAPAMRLSVQASAVDWDAAFREMEAGGSTHPSRSPVSPEDPSASDPEAERFRELHRRLHEAAFAVYRVTDGEIRILE